MSVRILRGDCRDVLRTLPDESVHCCISSPPYWGLRDYGIGGQMGLESSLGEHVDGMVTVFREVRRVLRKDGTLWLNYGDSYAAQPNGRKAADIVNDDRTFRDKPFSTVGPISSTLQGGKEILNQQRRLGDHGFNMGYLKHKRRLGDHGFNMGYLKHKDLCGVPWRVAFALQQPYAVPTCVKSDADRAWLAAIMDGEGCIGIRRFDSYREEKQQVYQDGFVVYTVVTNNDVPLLDRCIDLTGYGRAALKQAADMTDDRGIVSRRDSYGWRLDGNKAVDVIRAVYPFLIAKRRQACIAYTLDQLNKNGHGSRAVPAEVQEKKKLLWELIKRCNQREAIDLPSWVEEPKQEIQPGWYLRSDIIWSKPNPMPESVTDRPTKAHEYLFLMSKSPNYFYDAEAIKEACDINSKGGGGYCEVNSDPKGGGFRGKGGQRDWINNGIRNRRTVWEIPTAPFSEAHFATFPPALVEPCIKAGCPERCCSKCGAPWVREVEIGEPNKETGRGNQPWAAVTGQRDSAGGLPHRPRTTVGFAPSCRCDEIACIACGFVLDAAHGKTATSTKHSMSDVRESIPPLEENGGVLLPQMLRKSAEHNTGENLPAMQKGIPSGRNAAEVLQQALFAKVDGNTSNELQERKDSEQSGICVDFDAGPSNSSKVGLCDGASLGDGEEIGPSTSKNRSGSSHQRGKDRQSANESTAPRKARSRQETQADISSDMPDMRASVSGEGPCPCCGGRLIRRPPPTQPGTVLDCFGGAGTTGLVADRLKRNAILIELNPTYADMAERRIAGDCPMFADVTQAG